MAAVAHKRNHCGEVFITNNYLMVLECKFCCEHFTAYDKFLNHIFDNHFDNIDMLDDLQDDLKEYDDLDMLNSLENVTDLMKEEYIDIKLDTKETTDTNGTAGSNHSEIGLNDDATTTVDQVSAEISRYTSKNRCQNRTVLPTKNSETVIHNDVSDSTNSQFRQVCTKYRPDFDGKNRKYKCKICGLTFYEIHILRSHERRHSPNKPLGCTKCNKRFFTSTELNTHIRWHTGERPFVCTYCGSGFITSSALKIHEKRHLGERNHKCDQCGKKFYDGYQLRVHAVVHTRERNYKCDQCESTFTRSKSRRNHMKLHENALRYQCNICNMRFNQKPSLIWHEKSKHRIVRGDSSGINNSTAAEQSNEANVKAKEKYVCKRCNLEFDDKKSLLHHQNIVHADADALTTIEALEEAESEAVIGFL